MSDTHEHSRKCFDVVGYCFEQRSGAESESVVVGRWYPEMPPVLPGETDDQYTDRLTGADRTDRRPYDHVRNRQCSIGWHAECSERDVWSDDRRCRCPCHEEEFV